VNSESVEGVIYDGPARICASAFLTAALVARLWGALLQRADDLGEIAELAQSDPDLASEVDAEADALRTYLGLAGDETGVRVSRVRAAQRASL